MFTQSPDVYSLCIAVSKHLGQCLVINRKEEDYVLLRIGKRGEVEPLARTPNRQRMCDHLIRKLKQTEKKRLNVELPKALHAQLAETCKSKNLSISEVVQDLVTDYIYKV